MNQSGPDQLTPHLARIYRVALRMLGCRDAAEEIVQEVCVRAWRSRGSFRGQSQWTTWLHRLTINCAIDRQRADGRQRNRGECDGEALGLIRSLEATPDVLAEQRELAELARSLVELLPDDCRSAFVLTQLDGYTYDEAAAIEGKPRGTIASRVARARQLLIAAMEQK